MTVKELIGQLQTLNQDATVYTGYDGNVVVEYAGEVKQILTEDDISMSWRGVKTGDVVILAGEP